MSRQDKATIERNSKTLRELLKRPENKLCADCKRNDPRWASWNLGVFLCIRCSGIHRSMGTHISKVKSVDLDVWTPEQMASIQKWGNRLANLYWEAHLKAGHIPPDHKMDSFIRSKYESRRWAREGPPPSDPSTLDDVSATPAAAPIPAPSTSSSAARSSHTPTTSVSSVRTAAVTNRQPQPHQLLSTSIANRSAQPAISTPQPQQPSQQQLPTPAAAPANDFFTLDFHNPTPPAAPAAPKKDVKQNILSLFSSPPAAQTAPAYAQPQQNAWGAFGAAPAPAAAPAAPKQTSLMGNAGVSMWGANSGWNASPAAPPQPNLWGGGSNTSGFGMGQPAQQPQPQAQPQTQTFFNTNDIWASSGNSAAASGGGGDPFGSSLTGMQKKDDVFGDIWGGFK